MLNRSSQILTQTPFIIHFPKNDHILTLNLPIQITVYELTEIMASFTKLHEDYGEIFQGGLCKPKYLSYPENLVMDAMLQNDSTLNTNFRCFLKLMGYKGSQSGKSINLHIVYEKEIQQISSEQPKTIYKPIGIIPFSSTHKNSECIARCLNNGKICSIYRISKEELNFEKLESIIMIRNFLYKWQKQGLKITPQLYETFQSQTHLNIATEFVPIRLQNHTFTDRDKLETCIYQIARIINIFQKQGICHQFINLYNFSLTFDYKIIVTDILSINLAQKKEETKASQNIKFCKTIIRIWQELMRKCQLSLVQFYLPLYHYLKNGDIQTYAEFIRYFQFQRKRVFTPIKGNQFIMAYPHQDVEKLIENTQQIKLNELSIQQSDFFNNYKPLTNIFTFKPSITKARTLELSNKSTAKKPKPTSQNNRKQHPTNNSFKTKRKQRKISQYFHRK